MKLFLDTSVMLAASASDRGASRWIVEQHLAHDWQLVSADYCRLETLKNLKKVSRDAGVIFAKVVRPVVKWEPDTWVSEFPLLYPKAKDRPVIMAALAAKADYLLTLDRQDFHGLLGNQVYGVSIRTPGDFLMDMRGQGLL